MALTSDTDDLGDIETIAIGATDICSEFSIRYEYFCIDPKTGGSIYTTTTLPYQQLVEELRNNATHNEAYEEEEKATEN